MRFTFSLNNHALDRISQINSPTPPLITLARGIASSPLWSRMPAAEVHVRISPPEISLTGQFDAADIARLKALAWQTKHALRSLRYIGYQDLEDDCRVLAARLNEHAGPDLKKWYFTCMPRGGLIVLGMLSYVLGLERRQLEPPPNTDAPVVLVDDCALTGRRLHEYLENHPVNPIIFAPLYSSEELRSAIEAGEERVKVCISARDLKVIPSESERQEREFAELFRAPDGSDYWRGLTEYICFSWNEPDFNFFNPVTGKVEGNWTMVPHELCLKNGPVRIPVHIRQDIPAEFRLGEDIIAVSSEDTVTIENLGTLERFVARGIGAEIWNVLLEYGTRRAVREKMSATYDIDPATLEKDISVFIGDLVSRGILKTNDVQ